MPKIGMLMEATAMLKAPPGLFAIFANKEETSAADTRRLAAMSTIALATTVAIWLGEVRLNSRTASSLFRIGLYIFSLARPLDASSEHAAASARRGKAQDAASNTKQST